METMGKTVVILHDERLKAGVISKSISLVMNNLLLLISETLDSPYKA